MESVFEFVKSDIGITIAWLCTFGSTIYSFFKRKENQSLKLKLESYKTTINTDNSQDTVTQGERSVYTKNNSGDMKINM